MYIDNEFAEKNVKYKHIEIEYTFNPGLDFYF